jgi:ketosteroid isomerase-like protein
VSDENVEIIRRLVEVFNDGGIEATHEFFADEIEFREPPEQPAPRVAHGREEAVRLFSDFDAAWAEHRSEPEEIRALDDVRVLVISVEHFRGRDGVEVSAPAAAIFTLRDGKITHWHAYWNRESALAAAGEQ